MDESPYREMASSAFTMLALRQMASVIANFTTEPDKLMQEIADQITREIEAYMSIFRSMPEFKGEPAAEIEKWMKQFAARTFAPLPAPEKPN